MIEDQEPKLDIEAIRKLCEFAHANPIEIADLGEWMKRDPAGFKAHMQKFGILIEPGYYCVYQVEHLPFGRAQEHFSVSSKFEPNFDMVERLAKEFGLGDRSQWTMIIEPSSPVLLGFHIMKMLPTRGQTH